VAEFDIAIVGFLHVWTQTCIIVCWENQLCNDDITLSGSFRVASSVEVVRNPSTGQISLQPSTSFEFIKGPYTSGCREDWIASLFANVDAEISVAVGKMMSKWVSDNLQSQIQVEQRVQLMPSVAIIYQIVKLDFVPDGQTKTERGYVRVHAITTVYATAPNGTMESFPNSLHPWTGRHNALPLSPNWIRTARREQSETVLLGGVRFSQEMLTMLFQGLHYAGVLSPHGNSTVHDAKVLSHVDMMQPAVDIKSGGQGALLIEPSLSVSVACPDRSDVPGSGLFSLLDATFSGVMQRVLISAFVGKDHSSMGLTLQLSDISLTTANMTAFRSSTFFGSEAHFKAMAERVLRSAMPRVNARLAKAPVVFCGGGGSSCALVPFVPHPDVVTVPANGTEAAGFVQLSWACSCSGGRQYEQCQGFVCPEAAGGRDASRQLRGASNLEQEQSLTSGMLSRKPRALSESSRFGSQPRHSQALGHQAAQAGNGTHGTIYLSTFSPIGPDSLGTASCAFSKPGSTLRFGALRASLACVPSPPGSEDLFGSAYRLERRHDGRFRLHIGCDSQCSLPCRHVTKVVRLHECGVLAPAKPRPDSLSLPFMLSVVSSASPQAPSAMASSHSGQTPMAGAPMLTGCVGGQVAYGSGDALLLALGARAGSTSETPFTHSVHLSNLASGSSECVPCGTNDDLWCKVGLANNGVVAAAKQNVHAMLLCKQCSAGVPTGCLLGGGSDGIADQARLGEWFDVFPFMNPSGYSKVAVVTQDMIPLLQPCPHPVDPVNQEEEEELLNPYILGAVAGLALAAGILAVSWFLMTRGLCKCAGSSSGACSQLSSWARRLQPQIHFLPPQDTLQSKAHGLLWIGAALLQMCGLVWLLENPLVNLLAELRATTDMHNGFNDQVADDIVERSRYIGLAIFTAFSCLLVSLSTSMLFAANWPWLQHLRHVEEQALLPGSKHRRERAEPQPQPLWALDYWYPTVAFLLSESNSAIAFLAFCFWRSTHTDFSLLGGDTYAGETTTAVFSIRMLLTWISPFLLATHCVPAAALAAYARGLAAAGPRRSLERLRLADASQPFALASVLVHASIELILSIVYYRSGYGNIMVVYIMFGGVCLNVLAFLTISPPREDASKERGGSSEEGCCSCSCMALWVLAALQLAGICALLACLADKGGWHFLVASCLTAVYLAWASTRVFMEATGVKFEDEPIVPSAPTLVPNSAVSDAEDGAGPGAALQRSVGLVRAMIASPALFIAWLLEQKEAKDKLRYGARIKWRRLCLLMGSASLVVSSYKVAMHNATFDPWDDVTMFLRAIAGKGVFITRDQASVFEPLVKRYGQARMHHMVCTIAGASLFSIAAGLDTFSSGSPRLLKACRLSGFLGTLAYVMGMLIGNMPDYVGMLDFKPTLGRCGSHFCTAMAASMRAAFGAALLAQSGATFIPVLVSLPWTLGRIGFFLSVDSANGRAVAALTWGTLTCMLRLSILPATVAFVYRPVALVAAWYVLFLAAPSLFLLWIVVTRRTNLLWYLLWGWAFFLLPLLSMGSVALEEGMWPLWCRICRSLFSEDNWPNSIAEFTLSDVVISDMFFMIL